MCRPYHLALVIYLSIHPCPSAQTAVLPSNAPPPQTARQALLEMVFARHPAQFLDHLPPEAQKLLKTDVNALPLQEFSEAASQLQWPGRELETFDNGPLLLRSEDPSIHQAIEVSVESEYDGLDEDQLQLSLHLYRNGKPQPLPFLPTATFTMKSERGMWRLDDIAIKLRVPLGDKTFLDSLARDRRQPHSEELEAAAQSHVRTLATAQVSYAASFPELGFACSISDLGGAGEDEPTANSAGLIEARLSSGTLDGYVFSIEGCSGSPVDHFSISAVPDSPQSGLRAFCTDESAVIRFSDDGDGSACLSSGEPLP